jgi:DNA-binding CsgD family transcriptional regulator
MRASSTAAPGRPRGALVTGLGADSRIFDRGVVGMAILDRELRVLAANESLGKHLGQATAGLDEPRFPDLVPASARQRLTSELSMLADGRVSVLRCTVRPYPDWTHDAHELILHAEGFPAATSRVILVMVMPVTPTAQGRDAATAPRLTRLSARILEGVAAGHSTVQLADRLFLSRQGVEYHIGVMLRRFRVPNRTALACKAYALGIFGEGSWPPRVLAEYISRED